MTYEHTEAKEYNAKCNAWTNTGLHEQKTTLRAPLVRFSSSESHCVMSLVTVAYLKSFFNFHACNLEIMQVVQS